MQSILDLIAKEPAVVVAVIDAVLVLGVTFGLPITGEQKGALDALLAAVAGIVIRSQVSPAAPKTPVTMPPNNLRA